MNLSVDPFNPHVAHDDDLLVAVKARSPEATAFIVRAVNHHEALVEIVRAMTADPSDDDVKDMIAFGDAHDRGRTLLAALDADAKPPAQPRP